MFTSLVLAAASFFYWSPVAISYSPDTNTVVVGGRVIDVHQHAVANATVMIASNGDIQRTKTDADGRYIFFHLKPARYEIHAWSSNCPSGTRHTPRVSQAELPAGNRFEWDLDLECAYNATH